MLSFNADEEVRKLKKLLQIMAIVVLCTTVVLFVLYLYIAGRPFLTKNYGKNVETGGEIEEKYQKAGPYEVSYYEEDTLQGFEKYEIYYPSELESQAAEYPVVIFVNRNGLKASKYGALIEHMASWGFIAIGTEEEYDWNGFAAEMCVRHLTKLNENKIINDKENIFYGKVDLENVGITGHSQGGIGVFNAITTQEHKDIYKAAVALSPTNKEAAETLEWKYEPSKITTPILLISGADNSDERVISDEQLGSIYNDINAVKIKARRKNAQHGEMLYVADGYVTAWFMWRLKDDGEAAKAFIGNDAEFFKNEMYQDIEDRLDS